jgi:hypothetical protein
MTYSIVARDPQTGNLGVAVQSHWFSVGSIVTWAESGVGAIATQSFAEPAYGPKGLALMRLGVDPATALAGSPAPTPVSTAVRSHLSTPMGGSRCTPGSSASRRRGT